MSDYYDYDLNEAEYWDPYINDYDHEYSSEYESHMTFQIFEEKLYEGVYNIRNSSIEDKDQALYDLAVNLYNEYGRDMYEFSYVLEQVNSSYNNY